MILRPGFEVGRTTRVGILPGAPGYPWYGPGPGNPGFDVTPRIFAVVPRILVPRYPGTRLAACKLHEKVLQHATPGTTVVASWL
eukprot:2394632-Rhodomonas_salina.1